MNAPKRLVEGGREKGRGELNSFCCCSNIPCPVRPTRGWGRTNRRHSGTNSPEICSFWTKPGDSPAQTWRGSSGCAIRPTSQPRRMDFRSTQNLHSHTACWHIKKTCAIRATFFLQKSCQTDKKFYNFLVHKGVFQGIVDFYQDFYEMATA